MKKILITAGICAILIMMPAISAIQLFDKEKNTPIPQTDLKTPPIDDYDGTFVGGLGNLYQENGEWQFDFAAYLAGVYKTGVYHKLYGYIYNLEEEQIGYIGARFGNRIIIGYIEDMNGQRAPIIGFLFWNDTHFAGRIMSLFGPASHIIGEYTPNT